MAVQKMSKRSNECSCKELYPDWIRVSPTQIKTKRDCFRKLAFDKVDRIPRTESAGQAFGTEVHAAGEDWMRFRVRPPSTMAGKTFEQGIGKKDFLPKPRTGQLIEHHFVLELPELDRVLLHGYIDLFEPIVPQSLDLLALVIDYKYTKSRKWIPTLPELEKDPQILIYAAAGFIHGNAERVETRWCYFVTNADRTKVKGTSKRSLIWTPDDFNAKGQFDRIIKDADEIADMRRTASNAHDVKYDRTACHKFGGCEYDNICIRKGSKALAYIQQDNRFRANKEKLTKLNTENQ